jgi:hypothetical protein
MLAYAYCDSLLQHRSKNAFIFNLRLKKYSLGMLQDAQTAQAVLLG